MADNVAITPGSGATVAADDIGGVLHQRVKLSLGANNTAVDAGAGAGAVGTDTQRVTLGSDDPAVAAVVAILAKIIAAPATEAKQDTGNTSLASAVTALQIMDDWDESDRAKVNPIVGSAGVAGGAGAVGATTQRVVSAGLDYETVAASQTAQVLGATGATGDFLSHVILQPTTTAAGTMTILDNATVIFTFTTGTLADLRPITIPVNATSVSGAWKITTGANETATAFGDFT